ncbi:MAG: asparagine synthase-related protein [Terricaulis sp.]
MALRWSPGDYKQERGCRDLQRRLDGERAWVKFIDGRGVLAHYALEDGDCTPLLLAREQGAIFGPLFSKDTLGKSRLDAMDAAEAEIIIDSQGARLIEGYWGHYSAWLQDRGRDFFHVLRDPSGGGACFVADCEGRQIYFTHAEDFLCLQPDAKLNAKFLTAFIAYPRLVTASTSIENVFEILPGMRETNRRTLEVETILAWRPAQRLPPLTAANFEAGAVQLRETIVACARSWSSSYPAIAHRLSGGLDSSSALAALKAAGAESVVAFNEYVDGVLESDERAYARAVCSRYDVPLSEICVAAADVDYGRLADAPLTAKPSAAHVGFFTDMVAREIAAFDVGAVVTSGQGGDQVFHRSHASKIVADAVHDGLPPREIVRIALDTARLGRTPIWHVCAEAAGAVSCRPKNEGFFGTIGWTPPHDANGVPLSASALVSEHPWAPLAKQEPPARAERIADFADLQYYHQRDAISARFQVAPFLTAQPILELCLGVPPYVMTHGGRDRALFRTAFAEFLPEAVTQRFGKASTGRFHASVLERQTPFLREILLGGMLEQEGVIQRQTFERLLSGAGLTDPKSVVTLYPAVVAEMWLRNFRGCQARAKERNAPQGGAGAPAAGDAA